MSELTRWYVPVKGNKGRYRKIKEGEFAWLFMKDGTNRVCYYKKEMLNDIERYSPQKPPYTAQNIAAIYRL